VTKAEIERRFPEAVAFARLMRAEFGPEVRLIYARNKEGEELGRDASNDAVTQNDTANGS
jgi:hypothetical protein